MSWYDPTSWDSGDWERAGADFATGGAAEAVENGNPLDWGKRNPEMYDYNSQQSKDARTFGAGASTINMTSRQPTRGTPLSPPGQTSATTTRPADSSSPSQTPSGPR